MKKQHGLSLIEIVIFIVILGITLVSTLKMFKSVLIYNSRPGDLLMASQLADARMNLIILQKRVYGFSNISDPCSSGTLAVCTSLASFATSKGFTVTSSIPAAVNGVRTATITVSGKADAKVEMRFVQ